MQQLYKSPKGRVFLTMWLAQGISGIGSRLMMFAFGIWWFQQTGLTTPIFLTILAVYLPTVLLGPVAGVMVDRHDRRLILILVCLSEIAIFSMMWFLIAGGEKNLAPYAILLFIGGVANAFHYPAIQASVVMMVEKEHLPQANGLYSISGGVSDLLGPLIGAGLLVLLGMPNMVLLNLLSYALELAVLLLIQIPNPIKSNRETAQNPHFFAQARLGFAFMFAHAGLFGLQVVIGLFNFFNTLTQSLQVPLVLSRTNFPEAVGLVTASYGAGILLGGLYITRTGGVRPRVNGVFLGVGITGVFGIVLFGLTQSLPLWIVCNLIAGVCLPVLTASLQLIWQVKTPPEMQGRVVAARRLVALIAIPLAYAIAGFFADGVFTPAFANLESSAWLLGDSSGRGYAAMLVVCGLLMALVGLGAFLRPSLRNVERDVPDAT